MDGELVDAYLRRIGARKPERADAAGLRHLQERHVLSVPFENLSFHLDEPLPHSLEAARRIVHGRRGGCCFELNTAFASLLEALGFRATLLAGRIHRGEKLSSPIGHLALRVDVLDEAAPDGEAPGWEGPDREAPGWEARDQDALGHGAEGGRAAGSSWLVDVAQGGHSRWPLRLDLRTGQDDPHGRYLLAETPEGDIDVLCDGSPLYRMEMRARDVEFFRPSSWWYQTAPDSPFAGRLICVQPRTDGKVTLTGRTLTKELDGRRTVEEITTDDGLKEAYRSWFGIRLDSLPKVAGNTAARG